MTDQPDSVDKIEVPTERLRPLHQSDFPRGSIHQRSIIGGLIVFRGLIANRPSNGDTEKQVFFAEDESKLYIWNTVNDAWESVTLS